MLIVIVLVPLIFIIWYLVINYYKDKRLIHELKKKPAQAKENQKDKDIKAIAKTLNITMSEAEKIYNKSTIS